MAAMTAINGFVVACSAVFIFFVLGLHNYLTNFEDNGCEMTYMFEYPQYVKISLPSDVTLQFSRYGLYAYGEGQLTENLRKMKFYGIPVLFIPGNSGSYKQARSLASVSLRKAINSHMPFHFDYFTVDLNDEYSGLYGGILEDQTQFVHNCILRILQLYRPGPYSPVSVILIGHSMGGMVAKGLFVKSDFDTNLVKIIITLATPHKAPVVSFDSHMANYHAKVNSYWVTQKNNTAGNISKITLVSIGGGQRDIVVRSSLTYAEEADVNTLSTAVPGVWLSTDHLCSLWCKELVLVIVRALFDTIDFRTKQVIEDPLERRSVFEYHLLKRTGGKRIAQSFHLREVAFKPDGEWNEYLRRQFSVVQPYGVRSVTYTMIRLEDDPKHEWLLAEAINLEVNDWVFACTANMLYGSTRYCNSGINLSNQTQLLPSGVLKRKMVYLNLSDIRKKGFTHVVLQILPTRDMVQLNIDIHSASRRLTVTSPFWLRFLKKQSVIDSTDDSALYYSLSLPGFEQLWQAYYLHITPYSCQLATHQSVAFMRVPWSKEDVHVKISDVAEKPLQLRLQTPKPTTFGKNISVEVQLILDPTCRYSISIQSSILDSLGQLVRFCGPMLLPYVSAILLLTLRAQLLSLADTRHCVMFHTALASGAKPYYILPIVKMAARLLSANVITKLMYEIILQFDPVALVENNLDFLLMPFLLYMVAFALAYTLGLACWAAVIFNGTAANKMALRFLARCVTGTISWSEWVLAGLAKLPVTVAGFLIALSFSTCGALSLCVGAAFHFLKLCKMYEDYLDELFKFSIYLLSQFKKKGRKQKKDTDKDERTSKDEKKKVQNKAIEDKKEESKSNSVLVDEGVAEHNSEAPNSSEDKEVTEGSGLVATKDDSTLEESNNETQERKEEPQEAKSPERGTEADGNAKEAMSRGTGTEAEENAKDHKMRDGTVYPLSGLHFNFTLFLLWVALGAVHVPAVLVWAHNYGFSTKLDPDPSFETGVVLCFCAGVLWQKEAPNPDLKHYQLVAHILYVLAVLVLIFSTLSLHHLSPLLLSAFVVITFHQMFAGLIPPASDEDTSIESDTETEKLDASIPSVPGQKLKQA